MLSNSQKVIFAKPNAPLDFDKLFNVCRITLRISGIFAVESIFSESKKKISDLGTLYYVLGIFPVLFIFIGEGRNVASTWTVDVDVALEIGIAFLCDFILLVQGFCMYYSREEFLDVIAEIRELWKGQMGLDVDDAILRKVKGAQLFTIIYATLVTIVIGSYSLRPFWTLFIHTVFKKNETYDYGETVSPAIYPFIVDSFYKHLLCISFEFIACFSATAWWIAADMVFLQLATHLSSQYQIVNSDLVSIGTFSSAVSQSTALRELNSIGQRHAHLLLLTKKFQKIFRPILLVLMLVTSANICINLFGLQGELMSRNFTGVNKRVIMTLTTMIQPAIYCIYASDLTEWTAKSANAAYECNWMGKIRIFKKSIRLMSMCAQKELQFRIYGFFNVDLNLLTQIGINAARFFAAMNTLSSSEK